MSHQEVLDKVSGLLAQVAVVDDVAAVLHEQQVIEGLHQTQYDTCSGCLPCSILDFRGNLHR